MQPQVPPQHLEDDRGVMQGGAVLPSVGTAAAALPGLIRKVVNELADVHQVNAKQKQRNCQAWR
jgi:hypothetical protein